MMLIFTNEFYHIKYFFDSEVTVFDSDIGLIMVG